MENMNLDELDFGGEGAVQVSDDRWVARVWHPLLGKYFYFVGYTPEEAIRVAEDNEWRLMLVWALNVPW